MNKSELNEAAALWSIYVKARQALLANKIVRTFKSPEADFAEWLIATMLDGNLALNKSNPAYDVIAGKKKIQVKSLSKSPTNPAGYIVQSNDRKNNPQTGATHYAFVFFDEMLPTEIYLTPESFVRNFGKTQIKRKDLEDFRLDVELESFSI